MGWCQRLHKVLLVAAGGRGYILILFPILPQEKRQFGTRLMGTECWYQLQGREIW